MGTTQWPSMASIVLFSALVSAGCSDKAIGHDEARSEVRMALSFTAESQLFIDMILRDHITAEFAEGHARYLEEEIKETEKQLRGASPDPFVEMALRDCTIQLGLLRGELLNIPREIHSQRALFEARKRVTEIRTRLANLNTAS